MGLNNGKVIGTVTIRTGSMNPVEIVLFRTELSRTYIPLRVAVRTVDLDCKKPKSGCILC